jgi:hypothetical protein
MGQFPWIAAAEVRAACGPMAEYRAYIIGEDGHFIRALDLFCPDDDTAKECAKQLVDGHDVELWQLSRKIETFRRKPK